VIDVPPERFGELVAEALDDLTPELGRLMVNDTSPPAGLLGLYEGIPLTERYEYGGFALPDRITIFRRAICAVCDQEDEVTEQVRVTVVHEVAHHFGIDDDRLDELGWS
jgi:predicted Zn-dependent protease with MMP-like domain